MDAQQRLLQARRVHLPAHLRQRGNLRGRHGLGLAVGALPHHHAAVVVDAQELERRRDRLQVAVQHERHRAALQLAVGGAVGDRVGRVGAAEDRVQVPAVEEAVEPAGRVAVAIVVGRRVRGAVDQHDAQLGARRLAADRLAGPAVRQQQVVGGSQALGRAQVARRVVALFVAQGGGAPRLVVRGPAPDPVAQAARHQGRIVGEHLGGVPAGPAAGVLQRLRQVPMIKCREGLQPGFEQAVDQLVIEVQAGRVGGPPPGGLDAGPGDREPVGPQAEVLHDRYVVAPQVVMVAGDVRNGAVGDLAGDGREAVPDGLAPAPLVAAPLDLLRGGGDAPEKPVGEGVWAHLGRPPSFPPDPQK